MHRITRLVSALAFAAAFVQPNPAVARNPNDDEGPHVDVDAHPEEVPQGCGHAPEHAPMPLPEMVVDGSAGPSVLHSVTIDEGLTRAALLGDANRDGVVAICVEPGVYGGGFVVDLSDFAVPVVLYSSGGADHTFIRDTAEKGEVVHAIVVDGEDAHITHHRDWRRDAWIQGFDISAYGDRQPLADPGPGDPEGGTGDPLPPPPPPRGGALSTDGGAALLSLEASLGLRWMRFNSNRDAGPGGAVRLIDSDTYIGDSEFVANFTDAEGGAVSAEHSPLQVRRSRFDFNYADAGGALSAVGDVQSEQQEWPELWIYDSGFDHNEALGLGTGIHDGGAVYALRQATARFRRLVFTFNSTADGSGGAAYITDVGEFFESDGVWEDNAAPGASGGGLAISLTPASSVTGSVFRRNHASNGGGLSVGNYEVEVSSTGFEDNVADNGSGGGASLSSVELTMDGSWFLGNEALQGGGLALTGLGSITNSRFDGNHAGEVGGGMAWLETHWGAPSSTLTLTATDFIANEIDGVPSIGANDPQLYGAGLACHLEEALGSNGTLVVNGGSFERNKLAAAPLFGTLRGGGLFLYYGCSGELDGTVFQDNEADYGGGIFAHSTSLIGHGLDVTGNDAITGGGIAFDRGLTLNPYGIGHWKLEDAALTLTDSTLQSNTAASSGGGIHVDCVPTDSPGGSVPDPFDILVELTDVDVLDNAATSFGGGAWIDRCRFAHTGGSYEDNEATNGSGGAIGSVNYAPVELSQLRLLGNQALNSVGSALRLTVRGASLANLLVAENVGDGPAVWLYVVGGLGSTFEHVTIASNELAPGSTATSAGLEVTNAVPALTPTNLLVAENEGLIQVVGGAYLPSTDWLVWHPDGAEAADVCDIDPGQVIFDDPGLTLDYALGIDSPAAGAGLDSNGSPVDLGAFGGAGGVF